GGGVDLGDEIGIVAQPRLPAREVAHGLGEVLPHATRAIGGGDAAAAHVLEHAAAEVGDVEAVDDDQLVVELGHLAVPSADPLTAVLPKCAADESSRVILCGRGSWSHASLLAAQPCRRGGRGPPGMGAPMALAGPQGRL